MHPIQRSAAHLLIKEMLATNRLSVDQLAGLLGVRSDTVYRCARAEKRLSFVAQWRLASLGASLWSPEHVVARRARRLHAQLQARARYEHRAADRGIIPFTGG